MDIKELVEKIEQMSDATLLEALEILIRERHPELNTRQVKHQAQEKLMLIREAIKRLRRAESDDEEGGREFVYKKPETDDGTNSGAMGGAGGVVYTFEFDIDFLDEEELRNRLVRIVQDVLAREEKRSSRLRAMASTVSGISASKSPGGVQLGA